METTSRVAPNGVHYPILDTHATIQKGQRLHMAAQWQQEIWNYARNYDGMSFANQRHYEAIQAAQTEASRVYAVCSPAR